MAEGTYEYECSRAELLGIAPPNYEDWQEAEKVRLEQQQLEELTVSPNPIYLLLIKYPSLILFCDFTITGIGRSR